jgi:hypothetical protein
MIEGVLDRFAAVFSVVTGTRCRAAIKLIEQDKKTKKYFVYTLSRDQDSNRLCREMDKQRCDSRSDLVENNYDFKTLVNHYSPTTRCFICNDLTIKKDYYSSSCEVYEKRTGSLDFFEKIGYLLKKEKWVLPYKSTIVWPIQQREEDLPFVENTICIGFLTIDSESRGVFEERWDFEVGATVADALFHTIKNFSMLENVLEKKLGTSQIKTAAKA